MTAVVLLSLAAVNGAPLPRLIAAGLVWFVPWWAAVGAVGLVLVSRRRAPMVVDRRLEVLASITAELRSGMSLRSALHTACRTDELFGKVARRARLGLPMGDVVADLAGGFDDHGPLVAASLDLADHSGGSAVDALETVARLIRVDTELAAEVRAGSAPARFSLLAVIGAPLLFVGMQAASGSFSRSLAVPGGWSMVVAGGVLIGLGVAVSVVMARRIR